MATRGRSRHFGLTFDAPFHTFTLKQSRRNRTPFIGNSTLKTSRRRRPAPLESCNGSQQPELWEQQLDVQSTCRRAHEQQPICPDVIPSFFQKLMRQINNMLDACRRRGGGGGGRAETKDSRPFKSICVWKRRRVGKSQTSGAKCKNADSVTSS